MNGFHDKGLDEGNFGSEQSTSNVVKAFDAFPKTKASYTQQTHNGGVWTIVLVCASVLLTWSELKRWWVGDTTHTFSVEQGVGHDLQINMDVVLAMKCDDIHVNVQDASGDRILAGQALKKEPTAWSQWASGSQKRRLAASKQQRLEDQQRGYFETKPKEYKEEDVHDYLSATRDNKKFAKTPRLPRGQTDGDSCRLFGTMHSNKVQGDFHITARGHGYMEFGQHLEHACTVFIHIPRLTCAYANSRDHSLQLLASHQRALLWALLSVSHQPLGSHLLHH